ncbi:hypothetical protein J2857_005456 [Neorhizobium galegae]|uniref:hypothetical protein n=1 Tax=Neorhizobium galegae TaxID=399 RepID=UPI001AE72945|nr:hypothetical protein [Neorhizobium galegae]MBP2562663.1 hypothetical protein [Neorhizobium galegae]
MEPERKQPIDNATNFALARQARLNVLRQLIRGNLNAEGYLPKAALLFISDTRAISSCPATNPIELSVF